MSDRVSCASSFLGMGVAFGIKVSVYLSEARKSDRCVNRIWNLAFGCFKELRAMLRANSY